MRNRIIGVVGIVLGAPATWGLLTGVQPLSEEPTARTAWWIGRSLAVLTFVLGWYYLIKGDGFPARKKKKKSKRSIRTPI